MRISTDHGKIYIGLLVAIVLAIYIAVSFLRTSPENKNIRSKSSGTATSEASKLKIENSAVATSREAENRGDRGDDDKDAQLSRLETTLESKRARAEKREREREREEEEAEMERELEEAREAYDEPEEAARYLLSRRLPEGERSLRFELYEQALEQMRDLPQYSTLQHQLLPSLREMAKISTRAFDFQTGGLQGWTSLGPGNVGGRTRALLIHPRTPEVMFAGAASGGIWKTTDSGGHWFPLNDLMVNLAVNALAFDPSNPEVIYAGTGEGYFNADATRGAGIFRSSDGGNTWRRLESTNNSNFYFVNDIVVVSKNNSSRLYAATSTGVMRSLDGGVTWTRVLNEDVNNGCSDLAVRLDQPTDVLFAACGIPKNLKAPGGVQASIYRNDNAGALGQWEVVYTEEGMSRTSLAIAPSNQNVIYAVSSENGAVGIPHALHAVFRSNNGGVSGSWTKVNDGRSNKLNGSLFTNPIWAFQSECRPGVGVNQSINQGWYNNVIAVDPLNENSVWVGGVDLFRSDDGGVNWGMASFWNEPKTSSRYAHADHHVIVFHPLFNGGSNRVMFTGTDGGIFRAVNARAQTVKGDRAPCSPDSSLTAWASLDNGYAVTQFYHGAAFADGRSYLGGAQDNGVVTGSDEFGINGWRELLSGDGGYVAIDRNDQRVIYAETSGLSLKKSVDGGRTFSAATTGISNIGFDFIVPFVMDPSDSNRLWIGGASLYRTRNGADNWTQASPPLKGFSVTSIAVAPTDSGFVLAGTDQGYIHRTTTGLNSGPDSVWPDARPRTGIVSSLTFDPTNRDIAYATYSNFDGGKHVWRTINGGISWQGIDGAPSPIGTPPNNNVLPNIPVNCLIVDPTNTQRLYIGTDVGVFTSPDGGANWAVENTGFANVPVEWLSVGTYNGIAHLFAFTRGRGAWRVPLGQVCTYSLSATNQAVELAGGVGTVNVMASSSDCAWTVENSVSWISITSETSMRGNGVVTFTVDVSNEQKPRTGVFTIAGKSYSVLQAGGATSVSAASLQPTVLAPESIVAVFGSGMADSTQAASGTTLPTSLVGTVVKVRDSAGVERPAPLFFVSPNQINYLIPAGTAIGPALVIISSGNDRLFNSPVQIASVAPGFFTANASGFGVVVGQASHYQSSTLVKSEDLYMWDAVQARIVPRPVDLGPESNQVYLVLYSTGLRYSSSLQNVKAKIANVDLPVLYAGAQGSFAGLDQVNLQVPRSLAGIGEVNLVVTVDGRPANIVRVSIK